MFQKTARNFALAAALLTLTVSASPIYALTNTTPTVVTGGDPQPTGESVIAVITLVTSLVVL